MLLINIIYSIIVLIYGIHELKEKKGIIKFYLVMFIILII